jgi:hypothetical protein
MTSSGNMPLTFGAIVAGAIVIEYGIKNIRTSFTPGAVAASTSGGSNILTTPPRSITGWPASVNPLPGATASRLDQGIDATGKDFVSPWHGVVDYASAHNKGWRGGGYIAIRSSDNPQRVYYLAEGISPIVKQGQTVSAGQRIAYPVTNPYNQIIGNVEAGLANPSNVLQPLAQVVSDAHTIVDEFYAWLQTIGGPTASSTAHAGLP